MKIGQRFYRLKTLTEFLEDAQRQHGDRYDYSKVVYTKNYEKVEIVCRKHGPFWQGAGPHIAGSGCPKCAAELHAKRKSLTPEEALNRMKEVHGDTYDYSKVVYVNAAVPIEIICKTHGPFFMPFGRHVSQRSGCPKCSENHRYTTEEYIQRAKSIHGDKFDYSKTIYVNIKTKVTIGCPIHGTFETYPQSHLKNHGCKQCGLIAGAKKMKDRRKRGQLKISPEEFLERIQKSHGSEYDLSKLQFVDWDTPVLIGCKIHGFVAHKPFNLLYQKDRCRLCRGFDQTTEMWIEKAVAVHGHTYDYSESDYQGMAKKIKIVCPTHGPFYQLAGSHILGGGRGCGKCYGNLRLEKDEFVVKANLVHDNKYDYSKVNYVNNKTPVEIVCPTHGSFMQRPDKHLVGESCYPCGKESMADIRRTSYNVFLEKAKKVHGNRYTYPDFTETFESVDGTPIEIICPKHGKFIQTVHSHLGGAGCPLCNSSRGENRILVWLLEKNVPFHPRKSFKDCRNPKTGYPLYFDFYLPTLNVLIEFDGEQHFIENVGGYIGRKHKLTLEDVLRGQYRDGVKTEYAKSKNIPLIRIPYTEIKNVSKILDEKLSPVLTTPSVVV